ncbi:DUF4249 domain-containing protein [Christiangramia aquimixticola]|uniref:DUF4249 domain-containing protein n=1 Tax=Christiangramia aquimixticola TaxID=1697558 RepID=UPI003AA8DDF8
MYRFYKLLLVILLLFTSCEEVIDVELDKTEPRLVIEASLIWLKGSAGSTQEIKLSQTTPFYNRERLPVTDANIMVTNCNNDIFLFTHTENGIYKNENFQPQIEMKYQMELEYNGDLYTASEVLQSVSEIDYVEQLNSGGFAGDEIEIKAYYTDPVETEDFYLFKFEDEDLSLEIYEDEFTNGNQIFGYYSTEDIKSGNDILIQMEGISKDYYNYLFILRSQVGTGNGGPFETMPATVKGNIINQTRPENYPFGYFRLSEADAIIYNVE